MYGREVKGRELHFGVSGMLWRNALVMYDRETDTLWSHYTGEAIEGELKGERLEMLQAVPRVAWKDWIKQHPNTKVLVVNGKAYAERSPYEGYFNDPNRTGIRPTKNQDSRLPPKSFVLGILVDKKAVAVPLKVLEEKRVVVFDVGKDRIAAFYDPDSGALGAVRVQADDPIVRIEGLELVTRTGQRTHIGNARLLPAIRSYWFAWADFHPDTEVVEGSG
ncbi:MAG: hypothetical protein KatS3mg015_2085 [Fimbriimonadales bacterium]|nr:MAG: hypothetical protein KatS3mg015_2085 [Fimbriimonadales bacterium]